MADGNRRIVLASRPEGAPRAENFRLEEGARPSPGPGQVLLQSLWLSLDPYMRGRMSDAPSYAKPVGIGEVMTGEVVGRVVRSEAAGFAEGDLVAGRTGWQEWAVAGPEQVRRVPEAVLQSGAPVSIGLGALGMPGMTAWAGLANIGQPKPGETVVVAAASGPVGSMVGQIARLRGARAVGIAGGADKCRYVREALGFDDCLDHREAGLGDRLRTACPDGIDVYFENVGGAVWTAVLPLLNMFARVPVCGLVANYDLSALPEGPDRTVALMRTVLTKRLRIQGFIVWDYAAQEAEFLAEAGAWFRDGRIKHREDVTVGLENAPAAFMAMLKGGNFGKTLVKVAE